MAPKQSLSGKTEILENIAKAQNCVCSSPKFPDSKDQGYCNISHEISQLFSQELNASAKSVLHMKHPQITEI